MSKFVTTYTADLVINSNADSGLSVYRIEATWLPSIWSGTTDTVGFVIDRCLGTVTGGTDVSADHLAPFDDYSTSPSQVLTGPLGGFTLPALQHLLDYDPRSIDAVDSSGNNVSWGGEFSIDLTENPIAVAKGHALLVHCNYDATTFNVFFEE